MLGFRMLCSTRQKKTNKSKDSKSLLLKSNQTVKPGGFDRIGIKMKLPHCLFSVLNVLPYFSVLCGGQVRPKTKESYPSGAKRRGSHFTAEHYTEIGF